MRNRFGLETPDSATDNDGLADALAKRQKPSGFDFGEMMPGDALALQMEQERNPGARTAVATGPIIFSPGVGGRAGAPPVIELPDQVMTPEAVSSKGPVIELPDQVMPPAAKPTAKSPAKSAGTVMSDLPRGQALRDQYAQRGTESVWTPYVEKDVLKQQEAARLADMPTPPEPATEGMTAVKAPELAAGAATGPTPTMATSSAGVSAEPARHPSIGEVPETAEDKAARELLMPGSKPGDLGKEPAAPKPAPVDPFKQIADKIDARSAEILKMPRKTADQILKADSAAANLVTDVTVDLKKQQAALAKENEERERSFTDELRSQMSDNKKREDEQFLKVQEAAKEKAEFRYDPDRFYKLGMKGAAGTIAALFTSVASAIAVGASAYGQTRSGQGGPNLALGIINGAIDRDIAMQEAEYRKLGDKVKDQQNAYAELRRMGQSDIEAKMTLRAAALNAAAAKAETLTASAAVPQAKLAGLTIQTSLIDQKNQQEARAQAAAASWRQSQIDKQNKQNLESRKLDIEERRVMGNLAIAEQNANTREKHENTLAAVAQAKADAKSGKPAYVIVNPFNPSNGAVPVSLRAQTAFNKKAASAARLDEAITHINNTMNSLSTPEKALIALGQGVGTDNPKVAAYWKARGALKASIAGVANALEDPVSAGIAKNFDEFFGTGFTGGTAAKLQGVQEEVRSGVNRSYDLYKTEYDMAKTMAEHPESIPAAPTQSPAPATAPAPAQ